MKQGGVINISKILGMNNVQQQSSLSPNVSNKISPTIVHNLDTNSDGTLKKRDGYELWLAMNKPHSLFYSDKYLYCGGKDDSANDAIFRIDIKTKEVTKLFNIPYTKQIYWVDLDNELYISTSNWCGVWLKDKEIIDTWELKVSLPNDVQDSSWFDFSDIMPAVPMKYICLFGSRIFGAVDRYLVYSEPFLYRAFKEYNYIEFDEPILMIAISQVPLGLYIGTENKTYFLTGSNPTDMTMSKVGSGCIENTLSYCSNIKEFTSITPVWVSKTDGIVAGINSTEISLTKDIVDFDTIQGSKGYSTFRMHNGKPQYITSFPMPDNNQASFGTKMACQVFRNGQLI